MDKPCIIGVTGASGSGKTRFVRQLANAFTADQICLISMDNFYKPRQDQPLDENGYQNFDLPESIDLDKFYRDVLSLSRGNEVEVEEYTYNMPGALKNQIVFKPAPVILMEGIFIFHNPEIYKLIDLKIFIQAQEHIMLSRRIIRDENERGYDLQDVLYRYKNHVMPAYRKYVLPFREDCDIIINNNYGFEKGLDVIKSYISLTLNQ